MTNDRLVGHDLGRYHVESLVDVGGMGAVYRAHDTKLDRTVALKVLDERRVSDESFRARFLRESRMLASIEHPNIVPVFEADEADGELYIAMRFIDGPDLVKLVQDRGPLEPALAVSIISQVANALDYAHSRGLVHRDVKPANIMVVEGASGSEPVHAYLADFGLTKSIGASSGLTEAGGFVGTSAYVAPEQIQAHGVDHRADIYSLGCVFYDLLTGAVPFPRDSTHASLWAHVNEPPPKPSRSRENLPAAFDAVVATAMAKKPEERFQTAGAMAQAAREALASDLALAAGPVVLGSAAGAAPTRVPAKPTEIRAISGIVVAGSLAGTEPVVAPPRAPTEIRPIETAPDAAGAAAVAATAGWAGGGAAAGPPPAGQLTEVSATARPNPGQTYLVSGGATELAPRPPVPPQPPAGAPSGQPPRRRRGAIVPIAIAGIAGLLLVGSALAVGGLMSASPSPSSVARVTLPPPPARTPSPGAESADPSADPSAGSSPSDGPPPLDDPSSEPESQAPSDPPSEAPTRAPSSHAPPPVADTTRPSGSIRINGNNPSTTKTKVKLTLNGQDNKGVKRVRVSNSSSPTSGKVYNWPAGKSSFAVPGWTVAGSGAGKKTVYAWFYDAANNRSDRYSDAIKYKIPNRAPVRNGLSLNFDGGFYGCRDSSGCYIFPQTAYKDPDGDTVRFGSMGIPTHGGSGFEDTYTGGGQYNGYDGIHFFASGVSGSVSDIPFTVTDGHGHTVHGTVHVYNL